MARRLTEDETKELLRIWHFHGRVFGRKIHTRLITEEYLKVEIYPRGGMLLSLSAKGLARVKRIQDNPVSRPGKGRRLIGV